MVIVRYFLHNSIRFHLRGEGSREVMDNGACLFSPYCNLSCLAPTKGSPPLLIKNKILSRLDALVKTTHRPFLFFVFA